jgi:hypothetical protein
MVAWFLATGNKVGTIRLELLQIVGLGQLMVYALELLHLECIALQCCV